jgi:hypothetical protein
VEENQNLQAQVEEKNKNLRAQQDKMNQVKAALALDGNEEKAEKMTFHDLLSQQQMSAKAENGVTIFSIREKKKTCFLYTHQV